MQNNSFLINYMQGIYSPEKSWNLKMCFPSLGMSLKMMKYPKSFRNIMGFLIMIIILISQTGTLSCDSHSCVNADFANVCQTRGSWQ